MKKKVGRGKEGIKLKGVGESRVSEFNTAGAGAQNSDRSEKREKREV